MTAFFAVPVSDWPKSKDGTSGLTLRFVSQFICKSSPHNKLSPLTIYTVPLSVAIILPFLILAFTVNGVRERVRNSKRKLDFELMDVENRWKRLWIIFKWVIRVLGTPFTRVKTIVWNWFYWEVWWNVHYYCVELGLEWIKEKSEKWRERNKRPEIRRSGDQEYYVTYENGTGGTTTTPMAKDEKVAKAKYSEWGMEV